MNLNDITPLIITYNEESNIARCLSRLGWARQILVVDSGSTDQTLALCAAHPQVSVLQRPFDSFAGQCNFGLTQITTPWVLSLDADYLMPAEMVDEIHQLAEVPSTKAYRCHFIYAVLGKPLRGALYPQRAVLVQRDSVGYVDDGHAHRLKLIDPQADVADLQNPLTHDDRKPISRWFSNQGKYAQLEAKKLRLTATGDLRLIDRLRRLCWVAPLLNLGVCLFLKGAAFEGRAGWYYASQRFVAEIMISIALLDADLRAVEDKE